MTRRAIVVRVAGTRAVVRCFDDAPCSRCDSSLCAPKNRLLGTECDPVLGLRPGTRVDVEVDGGLPAAAAIVVLLVPFAVFAVVYFAVGSRLAETVRIAVGAGAWLAAYGVVYGLAGRGRAGPDTRASGRGRDRVRIIGFSADTRTPSRSSAPPAP